MGGYQFNNTDKMVINAPHAGSAYGFWCLLAVAFAALTAPIYASETGAGIDAAMRDVTKIGNCLKALDAACVAPVEMPTG